MFPPIWVAAWMNHRRAKIGSRTIERVAFVTVMDERYGADRAPAISSD